MTEEVETVASTEQPNSKPGTPSSLKRDEAATPQSTTPTGAGDADGDLGLGGLPEGNEQDEGTDGQDEQEEDARNGETPIQELSLGAMSLKEELDKIKVSPPTMVHEPSEIFDPANYGEKYNENLPKEILVLAFAENFRRQFVHLYRDRKPLFLNPVNECGTEKFVCTTLRPTQLPFKQLYDWDGAAEFVADYLNFVTLDPAHELPTRLLSPTTVLKRQKGNCYEYSILLCSLLLGAGYDAYVVSGYASREVCLMDETREICPLLKKREEQYEYSNLFFHSDPYEVKEEVKKREQKKYTVKPPKDLRSKFEVKQALRQEREKEKEQEKLKKEAEEKQGESEKPPPDPLHGLRIHSWVLILEGKREVPESFFIEPLTGNAHPLTSPNYLGIESVWNHQNYWVNMQDCMDGVKNMKYDLGDCAIWEYMFPSDEKPKLTLPEDDLDMDELDDEELDVDVVKDKAEDEEAEDDKYKKLVDMPPSWVQPLDLSPADYQKRCPQGKKSKLYKRAKLEKFAHYTMKDGLVSRLSMYEDRELLDLKQVKEFYANRIDQLQQRMHNHRTGWITEYYAPGRQRCLKEHQYKASAPGPENDRTMIFYHEARVDGLVKRVETPTEMTEHFVSRDDHLFYTFVEFGKRPKKFGPADTSNDRPILKMVERYHRDSSKPAGEDIAELVFLVAEEHIQVTYHTEDNKISSSTRDFLKPANADEKGATIIWHPDQHSTFQVDMSKSQKKKVELYQMMCDLVKAEEKCREHVRSSEEEVKNILNDRTKEEAASELEISVYDTERNEKAKKHRAELEQQQAEEKKRRQEMELDYLAPFLAQIGDPDKHDKITRQQAYKLKEDCLADLKQRLIDKANLIQARFEKETQELQRKQGWYQQNQVSMQKDDEEEYLNYCSEAMFRIHILELRLNRHKEIAPQRYMELERKIRADPRLSDYF